MPTKEQLEAERDFGMDFHEQDKAFRQLRKEYGQLLISHIGQSAELKSFQATFDFQQTRMAEAIALWRECTGKHEISPDLGDLLTWLMEERSHWKEAAGNDDGSS